MKLRSDILAVLEATSKLDTALRAGDLMSCTGLLDRRGLALEEFTVTHQQASASERESCRELLEELVQADDALQALGREGLSRASADLHRSTPAPAEAPTLSACFDRKA